MVVTTPSSAAREATHGAALFRRAMGLHRDGALDDAEQIYHQVLLTNPSHGETLSRLATLARQRGRLDAALEFATRSVSAGPVSAYILFNLGECHRALGRPDRAVEEYHKSAALDDAIPQVFRALGHAWAVQKNDVEAARAWRKAIALDPHFIAIYGHLSACLLRLGRVSDAEAVCREGAQRAPKHAGLQMRLASLLAAAQKWEEAARYFVRAANLRPASAAAHAGVAVAMNQIGRSNEALAAASRAIELDEGHAVAHFQRAVAARRLGNMRQGIRECEVLLALDPKNALALFVLANMEMECLRHSSAERHYLGAIELSGGNPAVRSHMLLAAGAWPKVDEEWLLEEHRRWANTTIACAPAATPPRIVDPNPDRKLRIGYVSADLRDHSVAYFVEPILACHDRTEYEPVVFCNVARPDDNTARLRSYVDQWFDTGRMTDGELAELVGRQRIDILVDLAGHTGGSRLPAFARRMAPIQVTYLGYPNTSGFPRNIMQYRLTDLHCDPPGAADRLHTERLIRLPNTFLCYRPCAAAPDVSQLPCARSGVVTFGCFNSMMKVTADMIALWSRVLERVPNARFLLKNRSLNDPAVREAVLDAFGGNGISERRVSFRAFESSLERHFSRYGEVDVALDTFPYHGTTTTCQTMWMGVPVVTLAGYVHRARVGVSLLSAVGLEDCIAGSPDEYVEIAARLANDRQRLAEHRRGLRGRMAASPLTDGQQFAAGLEAAYRAMWHRAIDLADSPAAQTTGALY